MTPLTGGAARSGHRSRSPEAVADPEGVVDPEEAAEGAVDPEEAAEADDEREEHGAREVVAAVAAATPSLALRGSGDAADPVGVMVAAADPGGPVLGVRGCPGDQPRILITGGSTALVARLVAELGDLGFAVGPLREREARELTVAGVSRDLGPQGARLLLTRALRDGLFVGGAGWPENRARPRADFWALVSGVRDALLAERDARRPRQHGHTLVAGSRVSSLRGPARSHAAGAVR